MSTHPHHKCVDCSAECWGDRCRRCNIAMARAHRQVELKTARSDGSWWLNLDREAFAKAWREKATSYHIAQGPNYATPEYP